MGLSYSYPDHDKPCSFKKACNTCTMVASEDRPIMCLQLECEHFTPCKKCGANKPLDENFICQHCRRGKNETVVERDANGDAIEMPKHPPEMAKKFTVESPTVTPENDPENDGSVRSTRIEITLPGEAPPQYSPAEKDYYDAQWEQYSGFYRDPTAYAICHSIIILEIELNWLTSFLISHRGEAEKGLEQKRDKIIDNLSKLRASLPDKEANDLSDDEKSIAMIHDSYLKEHRMRTKAKISRIFTPEAIALAPVLTHKVDPEKLLRKLGYNIVDIVEAVDLFIADNQLPDSPRAMLEWFGFYLTEKYALPFSNDIMEEEDEFQEEPVSTGNSEPEDEEDTPTPMHDGEDDGDGEEGYAVGD